MTDKVAIVGAGLVGRAWAISFARGGHRVMLFDADDKAVASALGTVEGMLKTLELRGIVSSRIRLILLTSFPRSNSCQHLGPIRRSWSARANDLRGSVRCRSSCAVSLMDSS